MGTHNINFSEQFEFTGKVKTLSIVGIVIGIAAVLFGFLAGDKVMHERTFANLLLMAYYFACVCMSGTFFLAVQYVAQAGWSASILRVPQAMAKTLPIAAVILVVVISAGLYTHNLYHHWHADGLTDPNSPNYDSLIAGKSVFLNVPFFLGRQVVFLGIYSIFSIMFVKFSYNEDLAGGLNSYRKSFKNACIFLVIYGFTTPIFAFDTVMSLEAHWFSTMFGWYNFAAMWVSSLATIAIILILLRRAGYMQWVNNSHLHNLGQFIFGFSIFWTYVWFAQFLLIYYANMPEETVYFYKRFEYYKFWFFLNLAMNFLAPVLLLMDRDNKRTDAKLLFVSIVVLLGHWVDYYQMIMPGAVEEGHNGFGIVEIGTAIGFVGLFTFTVLTSLSKKPLIAKNHPLLQESLHHQL
ncbi:quinol:cytochrome C oxidoreductase [Pedobacter sp. ISL-68]|uniref:quinol:cytochrome C oxidoreductase n=1 Tax=unclassified Pedobacter TaxID=2628915 RepID=UPI001BEC3C28|nr:MULTISPECIES: quinol:cytochrome C oxidoreductase [unclassified Pedobacter]MBT2561888.1 quinol:cytochrome C oxidoreductase [Pedobacter sp. ISL-64]MBT2592546.1 quinol:cytochrome C oxidoreductase [Pedobacter sp. ISL-68]